MDRKFVLAGLGYAILGLLLGIYMAASKNHVQMVTHGHIMLLGFVVTFIYGACHRLWLENVPSKLAQIQFIIHQLGTFVLLVCLFLLFSQSVEDKVLGPIMGISSILILIGMILMKVMMIKFGRRR